MKPHHDFVAERALAQHCGELLRAAPSPGELLPMLARCGDAFAKALGPLLAPLLGGEAPEVCADAPLEGDGAALAAQIAPLAANSLLAVGAEQAPVLVSSEAAAVLRLVDRAFGGKGEAASPLPAEFPLSAELMVVRLEALAIAALGAALGMAWPGAIRPVRRDGSLAALAAFAADTPLAIQRFTIAEAGGASWTLTLALPLAVARRAVRPRCRSCACQRGAARSRQSCRRTLWRAAAEPARGAGRYGDAGLGAFRAPARPDPAGIHRPLGAADDRQDHRSPMAPSARSTSGSRCRSPAPFE